jgi:hypothetical protein
MLILSSKNYICSDIPKNIKRERTLTTLKTVNNMQKISFGAVNLNKSAIDPGLLKRAGSFFKKTYNNILEKEIGQNSSNLINYVGKAVISPLMIFTIAPFTDEKKDSIRYSALLHPIQAILAFTTAIGTSLAANKILDHQAKKGTLGNFIDPELGNFFNPAIKNGSKNLSKLKNISALVLTVAAIPVTGIILNKILPKMIKSTKELPPQETASGSAYAKKLRPEFGIGKGKIYA